MHGDRCCDRMAEVHTAPGESLFDDKVKVKSLRRVWLFATPAGSSIHGIFQARVLEWVAISFCRGSSRPRDRTRISCFAGRRFTIWATRETFALTEGWEGAGHLERGPPGGAVCMANI